MTFGLLFWIIMLVWLLWSMPFNTFSTNVPWGGNLILWVLLALLGWQVFGAMVHR